MPTDFPLATALPAVVKTESAGVVGAVPPAPLGFADQFKTALQKFALDLNISGKLPGEELAVRIVEAIEKDRDGMSQQNRDRWDNIRMTILENWHDAGVDVVNKIPGVNFRRIQPIPPKPS